MEDDYQISWKFLQTYTQQAKSMIDILDRDDFDQMDIEDPYIKNSRYNLTELLNQIADVIVEGCVWALNHEESYVGKYLYLIDIALISDLFVDYDSYHPMFHYT